MLQTYSGARLVHKCDDARLLTGARQEVRSESSAVTALICSSTSSFICCCCCNCCKVKPSTGENLAVLTCCRSSPRTRISAFKRSRLQLRQQGMKQTRVGQRRCTCPARTAAAPLRAFPPPSSARALKPRLEIGICISQISASNTQLVQLHESHVKLHDGRHLRSE